MNRAKAAPTILMTLIFLLLIAFAAHAQGIQRISKEDLKAQLRSPDLILVDVRQPHDWESSPSKIAGAVREDPSKIDEWKNKYPKDKTIVLYCA